MTTQRISSLYHTSYLRKIDYLLPKCEGSASLRLPAAKALSTSQTVNGINKRWAWTAINGEGCNFPALTEKAAIFPEGCNFPAKTQPCFCFVVNHGCRGSICSKSTGYQFYEHQDKAYAGQQVSFVPTVQLVDKYFCSASASNNEEQFGDLALQDQALAGHVECFHEWVSQCAFSPRSLLCHFRS